MQSLRMQSCKPTLRMSCESDQIMQCKYRLKPFMRFGLTQPQTNSNTELIFISESNGDKPGTGAMLSLPISELVILDSKFRTIHRKKSREGCSHFCKLLFKRMFLMILTKPCILFLNSLRLIEAVHPLHNINISEPYSR